MKYRGRFAPSPTGPLHFGSLVAAVASYVDARAHGGEWLVRMEDVDEPRSVPGADQDILRALEAFGFEWDGPVIWQSTCKDAYREALDRLRASGLAYACSCSRREAGPAYPGTCRNGVRDPSRPIAWRAWPSRFRADRDDIDDFVLFRSDGFFAYQLAVVVDDDWQGITDVVRGADLLDSTPRQIWLQDALGYRHPKYRHIPVVLNADGEKLSKQTGAPALDLAKSSELMLKALAFLGAFFGAGAPDVALLADEPSAKRRLELSIQLQKSRVR